MFLQTFANHTPIQPFIVLSKVESTNNYAMAKLHATLVGEGTSFLAINQTTGRGQRGKRWLSNPGENITMSTVFTPGPGLSTNLSSFPFLLSAAMALACYDFIKDYVNERLCIKWPNDIYLGDRKAAGILIDNVFKGPRMEACVVGIGINVNQLVFPPEAGNAVSLRQATGVYHSPVQEGKHLHKCLLARYSWLSLTSAADVMKEYNTQLYRKGEEVKLRAGNVVFCATLKEVSSGGQLVTGGPVEQKYDVGEVELAL